MVAGCGRPFLGGIRHQSYRRRGTGHRRGCDVFRTDQRAVGERRYRGDGPSGTTDRGLDPGRFRGLRGRPTDGHHAFLRRRRRRSISGPDRRSHARTGGSQSGPVSGAVLRRHKRQPATSRDGPLPPRRVPRSTTPRKHEDDPGSLRRIAPCGIGLFGSARRAARGHR